MGHLSKKTKQHTPVAEVNYIPEVKQVKCCLNKILPSYCSDLIFVNCVLILSKYAFVYVTLYTC